MYNVCSRSDSMRGAAVTEDIYGPRVDWGHLLCRSCGDGSVLRTTGDLGRSTPKIPGNESWNLVHLPSHLTGAPKSTSLYSRVSYFSSTSVVYGPHHLRRELPFGLTPCHHSHWLTGQGGCVSTSYRECYVALYVHRFHLHLICILP